VRCGQGIMKTGQNGAYISGKPVTAFAILAKSTSGKTRD
jgi:hypothetical protein